jgi:hypothetical protein
MPATTASRVLHQYRLGRKAYLKGKALHKTAGFYYQTGYRDARKEVTPPISIEPVTTCSSEILAVLQKHGGLTATAIHEILFARYSKRTVTKYIAELCAAKKAECYVNRDMRKPLYRVVK